MDWSFDRMNPDSNIQIWYTDTKHQLADNLTKGNFTRDEWNNLLHLLNISHFSSTCCAENSSLVSSPKTMAKRMQEQKGEERSVAKSKIYSDELVFSCSDKFLIREKSDCIQKSGDTHSSRQTRKQDERKRRIRRRVTSATARCIPWRVNGQPRGNLSLQKRNQGMWTFPNLKLGVKKMWQGNRSLLKQLRRNPMHPANQTAREVHQLKRWNGHTLHTCLQPQCTIRKQSSPSSGRSTDENMTTLWMFFWTWMWLFGAYFWMPLFEQQFILNKTMRRIYDTWRIIFGKVWDSYSAKLENGSVDKKKSLV